MNDSIQQVVAEVLGELVRLGVTYRRREHPAQTGIWWATTENTSAFAKIPNCPPLATAFTRSWAIALV